MKRRATIGMAAAALAVALVYCGCGRRPVAVAPDAEPLSVQSGKASYYARKFQGRKTASGERYDRREMTAAHRRLPFGSIVRVTNLANGRAVLVRINDRGPWGRGRVIDISEAAAKEIDMIRAGVVRVKVEVMSRPDR